MRRPVSGFGGRLALPGQRAGPRHRCRPADSRNPAKLRHHLPRVRLGDALVSIKNRASSTSPSRSPLDPFGDDNRLTLVKAAREPAVIADAPEFRIRRVPLAAGAILAFAAGEDPRILSLVEGSLRSAGGAEGRPRRKRPAPLRLRPALHRARGFAGFNHGGLSPVMRSFAVTRPSS